MKIIMEDKDYKEIIDVILEWGGIKLNRRFINRVLKSEPRLYGEIYGGTIDTGAREMLMDEIAWVLIKKKLAYWG